MPSHECLLLEDQKWLFGELCLLAILGCIWRDAIKVLSFRPKLLVTVLILNKLVIGVWQARISPLPLGMVDTVCTFCGRKKFICCELLAPDLLGLFLDF